MLLTEIQAAMRQAIIEGDVSGVTALLTGGQNATRRLAIHQRHYEASLATAILGKFPATVWLVGSSFATEAAQRYVHQHPPQAPCIAEYGAAFPQYISGCPGGDRVPYLRDFGELEWSVGKASIATERPPMSFALLAAISPVCFTDATVELQPGVSYQQASWPVDELLKLYLTDTAPDRLVFDPVEVWLEVRGARGDFQIDRLSEAEFIFRRSLAAGRPLGEAAEVALKKDGGFDSGQAFLGLVASGLAVRVGDPIDVVVQ